jgi:hypothetical protein
MRPEVDLGDLLPDDDDLVDAYDPPAWPEPPVAPEPEPEPPVEPSPPMKPEPAPGLRSETAAAVAAARASLGTLRKDQCDGHTLTPKDDVVAEAEVEVRRAGEAIAREIDAEVAARSEGLDQEAVERLRCDVTVEVLGRIRPLGLPEGEALISVDSHKPALAAIHKAATRFPSDWLRASRRERSHSGSGLRTPAATLRASPGTAASRRWWRRSRSCGNAMTYRSPRTPR